MKKNIFITLILTLLMGGMFKANAQDNHIPYNKDLVKLVEKSLKAGADASGIYHIVNKKDKIIATKYAKDYLIDKGYVAISISEKIVLNFGITQNVIDKIDFIPIDGFNQYAYNYLRGNNGVTFNQLKSTGLFFAKIMKSTDHGWYGGIHTFWAGKVRKMNKVMWSGSVVNGMIDGEGIGLLRDGNNWGYFKGSFICGFPVDTITVKKLSTSMIQSEEVLIPFNYLDVVYIRKEASGYLLNAINTYLCATYDGNKRSVLTEYNRALTLNNRNGEFKFFLKEKELIKQNRDNFNIFISMYDCLECDFDNCVSKAKEILELYSVLDALTFDTHKEYVGKSLLWGTYFDRKAALADTAFIMQTIRLVEEKSQPSGSSSFRDFYEIIHYPTLYRIADAIFNNINGAISRYNQMDKEPDIFHMPSSSYASSSNSSSTRNSDRDNIRDNINEYDNDNGKANGSDSKNMLSCTVRIKLPDGSFYSLGNVECWVHKGKWTDEGGWVKCWVDKDGNCTISWEEKRGDYIYKILNICQFGKCYDVGEVELRDGGNYTLIATLK